jgi:hypothetical protein
MTMASAAPVQIEGLLALADRCEAATGPDRLLDANILWAINPAAFDADAGGDGEHLKPSYCYARGGWTLNKADRFYLASVPVPYLTASIDAAMTLVPEGWTWTTCSFGYARVWIDRLELNPPQHAGHADTPALALCAAALRARAPDAPTPSVSDD